MRFQGSWVCAGVVSFAFAAAGCSSSDSAAPGAGGSGGGAGSGGSDAGGGACFPTDPTCGLSGSPCLAMTDNSASTSKMIGWRYSMITVQAPESLKSLQTLILDKKVPYTLDACYQYGNGQISWLMAYDTSGATPELLVGSGPPIPAGTDPRLGTCFVDRNDGTFDIKPVRVPVTVAADGTVTGTPLDFVVLPVYLNNEGTTSVDLPIHQLGFNDTKLSADKNCVGSFMGDTLDPISNCAPQTGKPGWNKGGTLAGYITVDDSDSVFVTDIGSSLCVVLSGDPLTYGDGVVGNQHCKKTAGHPTIRGDWDAATNKAVTAGTGDAFHLVVDFAASAITIKGTTKSLDCAAAQ